MRMRKTPGAIILLAACSGPQSVLDPAGPSAAKIHTLGIIMWVGALVVITLVTVLMLVPFVRGGARRTNRKLFLWGGGVALPLITLTALVPYIFTIGKETRVPVAPDRLTVHITGQQFWWEMTYDRQNVRATSGNELRIPVGEPVELLLRATDVIHSLWIPVLAGKMDMIPGRVNRMVIRGDEPGVYRGQCAEYCGMQHALMAFDVIVMPRAEFDAWLKKLNADAPAPASAELKEGLAQFARLGCGTCHTIRGVSNGQIGPDLTLVGGRRMIGAGAMPGGGIGNIAGWIVGSQHVKPGNAMPSFDNLSGPQLRALSAYLASLR